MAIHPPSVEWVKLSGKWPSVHPCALSCRSRSGPNAPAWTRARPEGASTASTRFSLVTSSEMTVRRSCAGASRLPEMLVPPPNGISTASASRAARMTAATSSSSAGLTTTSGSRPRSPPRCRTRSRRLLPRAWTTRSSGSVDRPSPTAVSRAAARAASSDGSGMLQAVERGRPRDRAADVDVEVALQERPERRLVLVREGDALVSPPPPPHRGLRPPSFSVTAHDAPPAVGDLTPWRRTGSVRRSGDADPFGGTVDVCAGTLTCSMWSSKPLGARTQIMRAPSGPTVNRSGCRAGRTHAHRR